MMIPTPGIYPDIPAAVYHDWKAASNSQLTLLHRSPAHLKASWSQPRTQTPALALGEAAHMRILQPDLYAATYVVAPEVDRRTKAGKEAWEAFQTEHEGKTVQSQKDADCCEAMAASVMAHPAAAALLGTAGDVELSVVWDDEDSGVRCKARADKLVASERCIVDVKTTADASRESFMRSVFNFGYFRQAPFYIDGLNANGVDVRSFVFIAVEKEPPYAVGVYRLSPDAIQTGRDQYKSLLVTYSWCEHRDEWPCYSERVEEISLPRWAWASIETEVAL